MDSFICLSASVLGWLSRPKTVVFEDPVKLDKDIHENLDVGGLAWDLSKVAKYQGPFTLADDLKRDMLIMDPCYDE